MNQIEHYFNFLLGNEKKMKEETADRTLKLSASQKAKT